MAGSKWTEFRFDLKRHTDLAAALFDLPDVFVAIYRPDDIYDDRFSAADQRSHSQSGRSPRLYRLNVALESHLAERSKEDDITMLRSIKMPPGSYTYLMQVDGRLQTDERSNQVTRLGSQRQVNYIDIPSETRSHQTENLVAGEMVKILPSLSLRPVMLPISPACAKDSSADPEERNEAIGRLLQLYQQRRLASTANMSRMEKHFWKQTLLEIRKTSGGKSSYGSQRVTSRSAVR